MSSVSINLLPKEFRIDKKAQKKFQVVQRISIVILLILIFLATTSSALRILQSQGISKLTEEAMQKEDKVSSLKENEVTLVVLKNRLSSINKVLTTSTNKALVYKQILNSFPANVTISSVSVDQSGNVNMSIIAPDVESFENVFIALTSREFFENISRIEFESLSRTREGIFRSNLKISTKGS